MEKRATPREKYLKKFVVEAISKVKGKSDRVSLNTIGVDISSSGIGITSEGTFKKKEIVKLFLPIAGGKTVVPVYSIVKWTQHQGDRVRAGLQFLG